MKKTLSLILALILALSCIYTSFITSGAAEVKYMVENPAGVALYSSASKSSQIIALVREDTVLTVRETYDVFGKVLFEGYSGWVILSELSTYIEKNPNLVLLEMENPPDKLEYYDNEEFDPAGMLVYASYNNTLKIKVAPTVYIPDMTSAGIKTVKLCYQGHSLSFPITVNELPIDKITLVTMPKTNIVKEGLALDLTGLSFRVDYTDGRESEIISDLNSPSIIITGFKMNTVGAQTIRLTYRYDRFFIEIPVEVIKKELVKIEIKTKPTKLDYYGSEREINLEGMYVTAYYDNFTSAPVFVDEAVCENMQLGKNTVTISYKGKTATYEITLHKLEVLGLRVTPPLKLKYLKSTDSKLDTNGMAIYLEYNSGKKQYITKNYEMAQPDFKRSGPQTVVITHNGYTASFEVMVYPTQYYGDVDFDGVITATDARTLLRASAELVILTYEQATVADVDGSGSVLANDARVTLRMSALLMPVKYVF